MEESLFGFDIEKKWDYENGFYLTSKKERIAKVFSHYELYRSILNVPGCIIECGVFKGVSLIRFATFRDILENEASRKIIGFDAFGKFPQQDDPEDAEFIKGFEEVAGEGIPKEELEKILNYKEIDNTQLVKGNIIDTIPEFLAANENLKISLLHIDVDVYEPTKFILEKLYDYVVPGGLILFDDYGTIAGETRAADEFFIDKGQLIEKSKYSITPSFVRKK